MKPKNFPGRKYRRRYWAAQRKIAIGRVMVIDDLGDIPGPADATIRVGTKRRHPVTGVPQ